MRMFTAKSMVLTAALLFAAPTMAQSLDQHRANCYSLDPNTLDLQIAGCTALIESGQRTGAGLARIFSYRGYLHTLQEDYARAIADYGQAIRLNPRDAQAYLNRGTAYAGKQDLTRAITDFDQAIRLDPQFAQAYLNRGLAYYAKQDLTRAIADYDRAIRLNPQYARAFYNRGIAKRSLGKTAEGNADMARARVIDPNVGP